METIKERNYKLDNIKAVLIFLVVFGHMLELIEAKQIYLIIYSFHMPAFIFVTGYYAKFRPRKIFLELIMPYMLFQTLYLIFEGYMEGESIRFQYMKPYWLLWYLVTVITYYILLPMIKTNYMKQRIRIVILSFVISLLAGYDNTIGYYLSLSRTMVFLPFFVMGYYAGNGETEYIVLKKWYIKIVVFIGIVLSSYYIITAQVSSVILNGSRSYEATESGVIQRTIILMISSIWILALFNFIPNIKIPILSDLGRGTFSVFLIHGFIQRWLRNNCFFDRSPRRNLILAFTVSVLIVMMFGNPYFAKVFDYIFRGRIITKKRNFKEEKVLVNRKIQHKISEL